MSLLHKALAYFNCSFRIELSYRFALGISILGALVNLLIFFFIDKLFGAQINPHLADYGINYFAYVLVAIATSSFIGTTMGAVAAQLQREQTTGTLEVILSTPTPIHEILLMMLGWSLINTLINLLVYLLAALILFQISLANINLISVGIIMLLVVVSFNALGIISAGFVLVYKRGNPIVWLISLGYELLGGVYFPITVLPVWLRYPAYLFPIPHAIKAMQLAVYKHASPGQLWPELLILFIFCLILVPLSIMIIKYAFNRARKEGSLVQY